VVLFDKDNENHFHYNNNHQFVNPAGARFPHPNARSIACPELAETLKIKKGRRYSLACLLGCNEGWVYGVTDGASVSVGRVVGAPPVTVGGAGVEVGTGVTSLTTTISF
jgi:hypothetical protein